MQGKTTFGRDGDAHCLFKECQVFIITMGRSGRKPIFTYQGIFQVCTESKEMRGAPIDWHETSGLV